MSNMTALIEQYELEEFGAAIERSALPAVGFELIEGHGGRSTLGGSPLVESAFVWPSCSSSGDEGPATSKPLDFLVQIDLAELQRAVPRPELPSEGLLTFFYDVEGQPWGFDPAHRDGFRVVLFSGEGLVTRLAPSPSAMAKRGLRFFSSVTLPQFGSAAYDQLNEANELPEEYLELQHDVERGGYSESSGLHRLLGHSANIQGDMQLEAQLVSNGLYCGDPSGYHDPRAKQLEPGAVDWVLLLQLDTDEEAGLMWGDTGMLYFWIRRQDLAARCFERAWVTLQCS